MHICSCGLSLADGEPLLILMFSRVFTCNARMHVHANVRVPMCAGGRLFLIRTGPHFGIRGLGVEGGEHFGYLATSRGHGCDPSVSRYYLDKPDILLGPTRAQHLDSTCRSPGS